MSPSLMRSAWQTHGWFVVPLCVFMIAAQTSLVLVALAGLLVWSLGDIRLNAWPMAATVLLLAVVNSLKWPDSDLVEYMQIIDDARYVDLTALIFEESALNSIRQSEPVFRAWMWLVAQVGPWPRITFALFSGLMIYGTASWLCWQSVKPGARSDDALLRSWAISSALLIGVTFSLTGHLIRQYLAGGFFFVGVMGWCLTGRYRWLMWALPACLVHNSAVMLAGPLLATLLLHRHPKLAVAALGMLVVVATVVQLPGVGDLTEAASFLKEDGDIGIALPLLDACILAASMLAWRVSDPELRPSPEVAKRWLTFALALAVGLYCIRDVPLLFFRSYFYIEFVRAPILAFVCCALLRTVRGRSLSLVAGLLAVSVATSVCWLRTSRADWDYGGSSHSWVLLHSVVERWQAVQDSPL